MPRRPLGAVATGLVLAALTFMTLTGLLFYRPLPTIDGYYRFLGLDERAEVVRDAFGIPRIEARTVHDLFFLQGYVTAQDRFAQMEEMRRAAAESPADVPGGELGVTLEAYAAGVTKWIDQHAEARALPAEIALAGRRPREWAPEDSLRIIAQYFAEASGSSCVVVSGTRTSSGHPVIAADLVGYQPDPGWYLIDLSGDEFRSIGISLVGVPGLVAGHNGRLAWSLHPRPGDAPDVARIATMLIELGRASSKEQVLGPMAAPLVVGACIADSSGSIDAFGPARGAPRLGVLASGAEVRAARLTGEAIAAGEHADIEALRLALGPPTTTSSGARIVIDLGDLDASKSALSTGQSGHRAAFHWRDQAQLWSAGQLHRLAWTREAIARTEGRLVLRPR